MISREQAALDTCERERRAHRALALTSLLARSSREHSAAESAGLTRSVCIGLGYLEDEVLTELAELLPITRR